MHTQNLQEAMEATENVLNNLSVLRIAVEGANFADDLSQSALRHLAIKALENIERAYDRLGLVIDATNKPLALVG